MFKNRRYLLYFGIIFVAIVVILAISYYTISQFTFVGDRVIYGKKQSAIAAEIRQELLQRKDVERVTFKTSDGLNLVGFLFKRPQAKANLILSHGYRGSKEFMYGYLDIFSEFNILMFDFRAHGESAGAVISLGCHEYKDVIAAVQFMQEKTKLDQPLPLILLGISMGGAASLKAAEMESDVCNALIIDSTFAELRTIFTKGFSIRTGLPYYPFLPVIKTMFHHFANCDIQHMSPLESVKKIKQPILFIHSCNDTFIRPENSLQLYTNALHNRTKIWIGPKCRHGWLHTYYADLYKRKVFKFFRDASVGDKIFLEQTLLALNAAN